MTTISDGNQISATNITTWKIDTEASSIEFDSRMRMMFVSNMTVRGRFTDVTGTLTVDKSEPTNSHATITIGTASLDTKMAARDKHLYSADFFDVEHHPSMTFTSQHIEVLDQAEGHYRITGNLTIREVTHEVSLDAIRDVSSKTSGESRLTFHLTTVIDRRDWGITWSRPMQKIADQVNLQLTVQFVPASSID
jgi:polyisoprenoid-binding protein YceI